MSLFKTNYKTQKLRLQNQIFLIGCKIEHTKNERQKVALTHKKQELILRSNNLLKEYLK